MLRVNQISGFGGRRAATGNAITWASTANSQWSGSSPTTISYPSSIAAGDLLIIYVSMKPTASDGGTVTTPSGFTILNSLKGSGVGAPGVDSGDTNTFTFYKVAAGGESGTINVSTTGEDSMVMVMHRLTKTGGTWDIASATGQQTSTGNVNITFGSDPGVQTGDYILCHKVAPSDNATQYSSGAFMQTGVTFGALTQHNTNDASTGSNTGMSTAVGSDIGGCIHGASVTAGTSSAAPVFTATNNSALGPGPAVFIRIRAA